jgi:hypothetical protein
MLQKQFAGTCTSVGSELTAGANMQSSLTFSTAPNGADEVNSGVTATRTCNSGYYTADDLTQTTDVITCPSGSGTRHWTGFADCVLRMSTHTHTHTRYNLYNNNCSNNNYNYNSSCDYNFNNNNDDDNDTYWCVCVSHTFTILYVQCASRQPRQQQALELAVLPQQLCQFYRYQRREMPSLEPLQHSIVPDQGGPLLTWR